MIRSQPERRLSPWTRPGASAWFCCDTVTLVPQVKEDLIARSTPHGRARDGGEGSHWPAGSKSGDKKVRSGSSWTCVCEREGMLAEVR